MRKLAALFSAAFAWPAILLTAADAPQRPRILGDAHVAFYVSDLAKARAFYKDFLGYAEPYTLKRQTAPTASLSSRSTKTSTWKSSPKRRRTMTASSTTSRSRPMTLKACGFTWPHRA